MKSLFTKEFTSIAKCMNEPSQLFMACIFVFKKKKKKDDNMSYPIHL